MSLRECREIVKLAREAGTGVLFTLVRVEGSSYRQAGARLLVLPDGRTCGTLSGGCLEADIVRRAAWTVRSGAVVEHFSTAFDDTADVPYGLGCGGEVEVLAERIETPEGAALVDALEASLAGKTRVVKTVLPRGSARMARVVMDENGRAVFCSEGLAVAEADPSDIFHETLLPAQRLVIFGAGEDARPVARMAAEMGWTVVVTDTREARLLPQRFATGTDLRHAARAAEVGVSANDAVVLMTHSFEQDCRLMAELLTIAPRYLGLLGARHRSALLLQEAAEAAGVPFRTAVERTHAPVGIHLGGDGPEAVALAIAAEVQSVLCGTAAAARGMSVEEAETLLAAGPALMSVRSESCGFAAEAVAS